MAYSDYLADRVRTLLEDRKIGYEEKKMMGGLTFMVDDKMCMGVLEDRLMARIDPENQELALTKKGSREMDFTGRPMKGFLFIEGEGINSDSDLEYWVEQCLEYNPRAASSKKKKGK